jgi:hypothetical protein
MASGDLNRIENAFAEAVIDCGLFSLALNLTKTFRDRLAWPMPEMRVAGRCSLRRAHVRPRQRVVEQASVDLVSLSQD